MNRTPFIAILILIIIAVLGGVTYTFLAQEDDNDIDLPINQDANQNENPRQPSERTVFVYFLDQDDPRFETTCSVTASVTRTISNGTREEIAEASLRVLFEGPTESEKREGLTNTFIPSAMGPGVEPLSAYFNGVNIVNGVARVDFDETALRYLNSPACMQESVKTPIYNTLTQFEGITTVEYYIEGEHFDMWDA